MAQRIRNDRPGLVTVSRGGVLDGTARWAWHVDGKGWQTLTIAEMERVVIREVWLNSRQCLGQQGHEVIRRLKAACPDSDANEWDRSRWLRLADSDVGFDLASDMRSPVPEKIPPEHHVTLSLPFDLETWKNRKPQWAAWNSMLRTWFGDDPETIQSLQVLLGQGIAGNDAQRFAYLHGTGENGKSTFLRCLREALGDYAGQIPGEYLVVGRGGHPTGLRDVETARLLTTDEIDPSARWNESLIKTLSAGDSIMVRGMAENFRSVEPEGIIVTHGNELPKLYGAASPAIQRRFVVVPFSRRIEKPMARSKMDAGIQAVRPVALMWLLAGLHHYRKGGDDWQAAGAVQQATSSYLAAEDTIGTAVDAVCVKGKPGDRVAAKRILELGQKAGVVSTNMTVQKWGRMVAQHSLGFSKHRKVWVLEGWRLADEPPMPEEPPDQGQLPT